MLLIKLHLCTRQQRNNILEIGNGDLDCVSVYSNTTYLLLKLLFSLVMVGLGLLYYKFQYFNLKTKDISKNI